MKKFLMDIDGNILEIEKVENGFKASINGRHVEDVDAVTLAHAVAMAAHLRAGLEEHGDV